jgi:SAM-dependent methyltransferase
LFSTSLNRVPLLIAHPLSPFHGKHYKEPVEAIDIFPTLIDLSKPPSHKEKICHDKKCLPFNGKSLAPVILGETIYEHNFKDQKILIKNNYFKEKKKKFDTIIYLDVLEHITNDQAELTFAYKTLKKNGHLIINVPAFSHLFSDFDKDVNHVRRYNKENIMNLTKNFKYNYIKMTYYDTLGYIFSLTSKLFIKEYKRKFSEKIKFWDFLIPLSKIIDIATFNLLGKSLLIIIKK